MECAKFIMTIGVPGAGKSTWIEKCVKLNPEADIEVLSSDAIREEVFGDVNDQSHNTEVFEILHKRVFAALKQRKTVIYDATNLSRKRRKGFLNSLKSLENDSFKIKRIAVVIAATIEDCLKRNWSRARHVPDEVIISMYKKIQMPKYSEGWDEIYYAPTSDLQSLWNTLRKCEIDHDNHWHPRNISEHMDAVGEYVKNHFVKDEYLIDVLTAAAHHDIGKPIVKSRMKQNGEVDVESHYYNHADVGAYIAASYDCFSADVINLILYHMDIMNESHGNENFDPRETKAYKEVLLYFGKPFAESLVLLNEADRAMP